MRVDDGTTERATVDGVEIVYSRLGKGEPMVLVHGIGHRRQAWDPVVGLLAEDRELFVVDLPGFGESPGLPEGMSYDIETTMLNFGKFFTELGLDRPHIVGNSLGAAISVELAARDLVRTATALAPAGFWTPPERRYALTLLQSLRMSARVPDRVLQRIARTPALRARLQKSLYVHADRISEETFIGDARAMVGAVGFKPTARAGGRYENRAVPVVPTTIAWGTRDHVLLPRQADIARRRLPGARHVSLPGCGHVPMIDDPELIAQVIMLGSTAKAAAA